MRSVQSYKHYIYARCNPGQVGRWNLIVARGMLKPVYFAFETMLEVFLQTTHFVKSRAHSPSPTSKIIAIMIALRRAILMKANPVVSLDAHRLFSGRAGSCKKDPCFCQHARSCARSQIRTQESIQGSRNKPFNTDLRFLFLCFCIDNYLLCWVYLRSTMRRCSINNQTEKFKLSSDLCFCFSFVCLFSFLLTLRQLHKYEYVWNGFL